MGIAQIIALIGEFLPALEAIIAEIEKATGQPLPGAHAAHAELTQKVATAAAQS